MLADNKNDLLKKDFETWEQERQEYMKQNPERRKKYKNDLGHEIKQMYTPLDLEERGFEYEKNAGFPGHYPYTRGQAINMNRSRHVSESVYSGFGLAEQTKERYEKLFKWGAKQIDMAWDLPTQIGYDSDHIMATGEVGRTGVAIDSFQDMEIIFEDLNIKELGELSTLSNSMGPIGLGLMIAISRKQGLKTTDFRGVMQNDPLKEYAARGTYIFPPEPSVKLACDVVEWCINNAPHWKPITFCGNHFNAAGAGSVNATAFAMMNGFVYIDELISRGYTIDQIGPLVRMFLDEREDFFTMTCLARAARKVWAEQLHKRYGAEIDSPATALDSVSYSHGGETLQEPINNVLRIGFAALAYYLGGVTHLYNAGFDEAMGLTSDQTSKVSLRTSQIINNELGFSKTIDPLAGSYYIESLTMDIARDITAQIEIIDTKYGGSIQALNSGYYHGEISKGAVRRQEEYENGERAFVSLNIYKTDEELPRGAFRLAAENEEKQRAKLDKLRKTRDNEKVKKCLEKLEQVAKDGTNTVETVVECFQAYCTLGEICNVWRGVYGEHRTMTTF